MSQRGGGPGDETSLPSAPDKGKQRQIIKSVLENEPAPLLALSTLEERLPYECSRPTIKTRLEELELRNEVKERPFNPHAEEPTKFYHLVHEETEWMAPPDAAVISDQEQQVLDRLRDDDGALPDGAPTNATILSTKERTILEKLRDEDGEMPDSRYVERPYEHPLLDTRIGDCFYQGHNLFGDLTLAGLGLTVLSYIAFQTAGVLPVSQGTIGLMLFVSIVSTLVGCFGILGSAVFNAAQGVAG